MLNGPVLYFDYFNEISAGTVWSVNHCNNWNIIIIIIIIMLSYRNLRAQ